MLKLILFLLFLLTVIYYIMLFLQVMGLIQFTDKKLTAARMFIPFYYWFADPQEKSSKENSKTTKNNQNNGTKENLS